MSYIIATLLGALALSVLIILALDIAARFTGGDA